MTCRFFRLVLTVVGGIGAPRLAVVVPAALLGPRTVPVGVAPRVVGPVVRRPRTVTDAAAAAAAGSVGRARPAVAVLVGVLFPLAPPPEGVGRALTGFVVRGARAVAGIVSSAAGTAAAIHVVAAVPVDVAVAAVVGLVEVVAAVGAVVAVTAASRVVSAL